MEQDTRTANITEDLQMMHLLSDLVSGRWKLAVLWLLQDGPVRFGEISRALGHITQTTLTRKLNELEQEDLISRKIYPQVPPRVEYSLTADGAELVRHIHTLMPWLRAYADGHARPEHTEE